MFKKLKQKISEEQAPPRRAVPLQPQGAAEWAPSKSPPLSDKRSRTSSFTDQNDEGSLTPDKESAFPDKQEKQRIPHKTCQVMLEEHYHALNTVVTLGMIRERDRERDGEIRLRMETEY